MHVRVVHVHMDMDMSMGIDTRMDTRMDMGMDMDMGWVAYACVGVSAYGWVEPAPSTARARSQVRR